MNWAQNYSNRFQISSNGNYFTTQEKTQFPGPHKNNILGLFRVSSQKGYKLTKLNSAWMTSSGLLLSTVIFIIALNLTPGIARGKHRGVVVLHSS
jgi:hypothetical protein